MSDIILKAVNISKQYRLGLVGTGTLSHDLNRLWAKIRGKEDPYLQVGAVNDRSASASSDYVWALKEINFEVKRGEILGIIGKNGAGKSTLLKILSRVTSPTTGSIKTGGRIASLLEVGTGMHPELTGRENIFLNGAILGMNKTEISSKIDEIIEFSGCQMYIDTPVKRYSSGMRVRLGFAVAAFLEPDILVVDEVLAVGDAEFQKKAIGKMQDISNTNGRTVLFVSHNMASIKNLCTRCVVLKNGSTQFDGKTEEAISFYLSSANFELVKDLETISDRSGTGEAIFSKFYIEDKFESKLENTLNGDTVFFCFEILVKTIRENGCFLDIGFSIHTDQDELLSVIYSSYQQETIKTDREDRIIVKCKVDNLPLNSGDYIIKGRLLNNNIESDWPKVPIGSLNVIKGDFYGTGNLGFDGTSKFLMKGTWHIN
jgi:lipopolysaccharide transport system ATP-binding protein